MTKVATFIPPRLRAWRFAVHRSTRQTVACIAILNRCGPSTEARISIGSGVNAVASSPAAPASSPRPAHAAAATTSPAPGATTLPPAGTQPAAEVATAAPSMVANPKELTLDGKPLPYTAGWYHRHLYNPRSISE